MKTSIMKRKLTGVLVAALVMAPVISVAAAGSSETPSGSTVAEQVSSVVEAVPESSTVAGVVTTTKGAYLATSVDGAAVTTSTADIVSGYGLAAGETPYAKMTNVDPKKSYLAKTVIDAAAASQGAEVGPMLNVEFGKMSDGKYSLLSSDGADIRVTFGIPKSFAQADKTFAVVCVRAGGVVSILNDVDDNPDTVTFDTKGGAGTYAIIKF